MATKAKVSSYTVLQMRRGMPLVAITTPANGDERQQVLPMLTQIRLATGKPGNPKRRPKPLAADKGYDALMVA